MLLHSMMSMSFGQTQRHDFGEEGKERCGIKHVKESVLLRPYFAYNTHKYGTIVFNLELPTYIRDKSSFRYSYQIRKVIISIPEQKKKMKKKSLIYSKLNLATVYMYIMYLDYLLTILKLSSRSAGDLRSFRTTPRFLVFFCRCCCTPHGCYPILIWIILNSHYISNLHHIPLDRLSQSVPGSWFMGAVEQGK